MPPTAKPTENPAATRGKCAFIWRTSSRRRLAAHQREADGDRQREQHEEGKRDPHAVPHGEHQPARRDHHQVDPEHACRHGRERDQALGPGERRGDHDPDRRDREVHVRERRRRTRRGRVRSPARRGRPSAGPTPPSAPRAGGVSSSPGPGLLVGLAQPADELGDDARGDLGRIRSAWSNAALRSRNARTGVAALTVADRGCGSRTAISPTTLPGPIRTRLSSRTTSTSPSTMTKSQSSTAPVSISTEPSAYSTSTTRAIPARTSGSGRTGRRGEQGDALDGQRTP